MSTSAGRPRRVRVLNHSGVTSPNTSSAVLRTGVVEINGSPVGLSAPFGGFKLSGIGRENGPEGLDSYTEPRSIGLPPELASSLA